MSPQKSDRRGLLIILSSPSGAGKSTLAKRITMCFGQDVWIPRVAEFIELDYVSHTT